MYIFIRQDLSHPQQVVQASHACIEATKAFLESNVEHPHLVVVGVADESRLLNCVNYLRQSSINFIAFQEPDMNGETTALATEPLSSWEQRKLLRRYQLLKGSKDVA